MKKVVYITGCLGFIGSYITKSCLDLGWLVMGVDKGTYAANRYMLPIFKEYSNFDFIEQDINNLKFIYECDYIINTAAETHVGNSIVNSSEFVTSNVGGVYNILELIRKYRSESSHIPTLIHFSTDEVYGDIIVGSHVESDVLKPSNPYSATKAAADMLILAWNRTYKIPYVIVRPTNNYGERQYVEKLIPKICKYLQIGKIIPLHNKGTAIRNWLHAQDTANAVLKIIETNQKNEIFNICGGFEQANYETACKVMKEFDSNLIVDEHLDFSYSRPGEDMRYSLNDDKIRELGWKPSKVFDDELKTIVNFYRKTYIW